MPFRYRSIHADIFSPRSILYYASSPRQYAYSDIHAHDIEIASYIFAKYYQSGNKGQLLSILYFRK